MSEDSQEYQNMNKPATWSEVVNRSPLLLYAGDLPDLPGYEGYIGFSITKSDSRHIAHSLTSPFPLPDNSVDRIQCEDVLEHINLTKLPAALDEFFRILKPGGLLRISVPDYRCDILKERTEKSSSGKLLFDPMGGGTREQPGHVWFPTIEKVRALFELTEFSSDSEIQWLHYYETDGKPVLNAIDYSLGMITRTPDFDDRVQNPRRPMSLVVDAYKGFAPKKVSVLQPKPQPTSFPGQKSILFVNTVYPAFIDHLYRNKPELLLKSYQDQLTAVNATRFGDADFYSNGTRQSGWTAHDIVVNCEPLQKAWCKENAMVFQHCNVMVEQIKQIKPDVVYFQNLALLTPEIHAQIRPLVSLIVGQIASPVPPQAHLKGFDIIISSFPHFVERFREQGICSFYQPLAFEPSILVDLGNRNVEHPFTFVGGISGAHTAGTLLLEKVALKTPLEIWGYGKEGLAQDSPLRSRHHGEAWGLSMFKRLQSSRITLNRHIDVAENNANNMRLFEATGCGALLITDMKDNLSELFEIGTEVVAYRTPEECIELVKYYLAHPEEAETIAKNGQRRTLRDHTYAKRMSQTAELLERQLKYRDPKNQLPPPDMGNISTGYTNLNESQVTDQLKSGWKDAQIPIRQRALVQQQLMQMYQGQNVTPYQVLAAALKPYLKPDDSLLEIGCSSGYYSEVLSYLLSTPIRYTGADYSEAFIDMAKQYYPESEFYVADGAKLPFEDNAFRFAVSGCVLLHTPNYVDHIRETVRVSGEYIIAHRTPVCKKRDTFLQKKNAYGVETVELTFNEIEFIKQFSNHGAELKGLIEFSADPAKDEYQVTYLFRKI